MTKRQYIHISAVFLLTIAAVIIILWITRRGVGVTPDSVAYLCAADNFLKGNGLVAISSKANFIPMTHFPPLYPLLITMGEFIGIRVLDFCKYINIIVYILNVIFFGLIIYKSTNSNIEASCLGSLLMISSYDVLRAHICAMTDPIFILLTLATFITLILYIDKRSAAYFIACSILVSISFLLRYVGLSLVLTAIMGILILSKKYSVKKVKDVAIFLVISTIPMMLWLARNLYLTGNPFDRTLGYYKLSLNNFPEKVGYILQKLGSLSLPVYLLVIITLVLLTLTVIYYKKSSQKLIIDSLLSFGDIPCLIGLFILNYLLVVFIAVLFLDNAIYLGFRILLPVIVFSELIIFIFLARKLSYKKLLIFTMIIIGFQLYRWNFNKVTHEELVYSGPQWVQSEIIKKVNKLPGSYKIYSNGPDVIYYLTGKLAYAVPESIISDKNVPNYKLISELKNMSLNFNNDRFVLVWLDNIGWRKYLVTKKSLVSALMLDLIYQTRDGSIHTSKNNLRELTKYEPGDAQ